MGKAGVYKACFGEGYYLSFILQAAKGTGEDYAVIIYIKAETSFVFF